MDRPPTTPIPPEATDILDDLPTGYLATVRPDGRLSVTPMAVMYDGEHVRLSTTKDRRKYRNLQADPRLALAIPHRNNPNRYIELRGTAVMSDDADRSFIDGVARRYMGADRYPFDKEWQERVTITVAADVVSYPAIPLADDPPQAPDEQA